MPGPSSPAACRTPARAGCRSYHQQGGRADLPDRDRLLRLRDAARALLARSAGGCVRREPGAGDRGQAQPGRQARGRRPAAGQEGHRRDRPGPRRSGRLRLLEPGRPTPSSATSIRCSISSSASRMRPDCPSASSPRSGRWSSGTSWPSRCSPPIAGSTSSRSTAGEGGTGAAPLVFTDHVALPYVQAHATAYRSFAMRGMAHQIVFVGLGPPRPARIGAVRVRPRRRHRPCGA